MNHNDLEVKEIVTEADFINSHHIIQTAFKTVADQFNLTPENCPSNPAFITLDKFMESKEKGVKFFGLFLNGIQIGLVGIEKSNPDLYYMERLCVLPEYRHGSYGKILMDFVFEMVKAENGKKVSIALMDNHTVLKNWYQQYGFKQTGVKVFQHLPFDVCFMEKEIEG